MIRRRRITTKEPDQDTLIKRRQAEAAEEDERSRRVKQNAMIKALEACRGLVYLACKKAEVSERTHRYWAATDAEYADRVRQAVEFAKDVVELKLLELAEAGDLGALRTILAAKAKDRGYGILRQEQTGKDGGPIETISTSPTIEEVMRSTTPEAIGSLVRRVVNQNGKPATVKPSAN